MVNRDRLCRFSDPVEESCMGFPVPSDIRQVCQTLDGTTQALGVVHIALMQLVEGRGEITLGTKHVAWWPSDGMAIALIRFSEVVDS